MTRKIAPPRGAYWAPRYAELLEMQADSEYSGNMESEDHLDFRKVGYTADAINYPLSDAAFAWLCRFNGIPLEKAPREWRYAPNAHMQRALDERAAQEQTP